MGCKTARVEFRIGSDLKHTLVAYGERVGCSLSEVIRAAVERYVELEEADMSDINSDDRGRGRGLALPAKGGFSRLGAMPGRKEGEELDDEGRCLGGQHHAGVHPIGRVPVNRGPSLSDGLSKAAEGVKSEPVGLVEATDRALDAASNSASTPVEILEAQLAVAEAALFIASDAVQNGHAMVERLLESEAEAKVRVEAFRAVLGTIRKYVRTMAILASDD